MHQTEKENNIIPKKELTNFALNDHGCQRATSRGENTL